MKKLLLILILFFTGLTSGQSDSKEYLVPSFYSTAGDYENGNSSTSYSGFLLGTVEKSNYVIVGYDYLTVNQPSLDYKQQMFVAGEYLTFSKWIISGHFAYVGGEFDSESGTSPVSEFMNIYNINIKHNINLFYIGASYTFSNIRGAKTLSAHQMGVTFDLNLNDTFSFHIYTFHSHLTDGRDLTSGNLSVHYKPVRSWEIIFQKTMGKRAYFFDSERLTLFNQHETLRGSLGLKTIVSFVTELDFVFSYDQYDFGSYAIDYYSGGVKFHLPI